MAEKLWQIVVQSTMGWHECTEPNCKGLTKEQARVRLNQLLNEGHSPKDLKAVTN